MTQEGLEKKSEIKRFKVWVFESQKEKTVKEVQNICKNLLSKLSSIKYCEPDAPLNTTDELAFTTYENEEEVEDKNLKTCNIIDSKVGLLDGKLSDYWAQEMIGADLMKEEIQQLPPVKEHLVECFDQEDHGVSVKNLISDKGKHSVLPEVGKSMTISQNHTVSDFLKNSDRLLTKVDTECGAAPTNTGSVQ